MESKTPFLYPASREKHFSFAKWQKNQAELETIKCEEKADPEPTSLKLY